MKLTAESVRDTISKAKSIYRAFALQHIGADATVRSVDNLRSTCEQELSMTIRVLTIEAESEAVRGMFVKTSDRSADICVLKKLNFCWTRFVVCKELFHVVLDTPEDRNMDLVEHIREMLLTFPVIDAAPSSPVVLEFLAEIAAMEFLFPYSARVKELVKVEANPAEIAERYKVPRVYIEKYLSPDFIEALADADAATSDAVK